MGIKEGLRELWVRTVWTLTPKCTEMRELSSRQLDGQLGFGARIRWRMHFLICHFCHRYYRQLRFLRRAAHEAHHHPPEGRGQSLRDEAREEMKQRLREAARD